MDTPAWARHLPPGVAAADVDLLAHGTLPQAWAATWAARPEAPVLHTAETGWLTAGDVAARARRAAAALDRRGLRAGDRLLVSGRATADLVALHAAALGRGLVVVPANTAYTGTELAHVAEDSGAALAALDDEGRGPGIPTMPIGESGDGELELDQARPDAAALIAYTSGTTGKPKGAVLTHANLLASAEGVRVAWRWTAGDRLILALPLFHMHGLGVGVHGTLLAGASMVLLERFDVDAVLDAAAAHHATLFFGVPTMYARLGASARLRELAPLRLCVSGSAPLAADLHDRIAAGSGQRVLERYGMTETVMLVSNPYDGERRPGSVGFPLPGVDVELAADGEIRVRGPNVFSGYWGQAGPATDGGWFATGDVGRFDDDGYLHIVGRTKELIISGGFNVYPREVEEVLLQEPAVREAAVAGTPDTEWGEVVTAYLVMDPGTTDVEHGQVEARLVERCRAALAPYKRPRLVRFVDSLPRNALGKVDRGALAALPPAQ